MLRLLCRATLFSYTTLFRSGLDGIPGAVAVGVAHQIETGAVGAVPYRVEVRPVEEQALAVGHLVGHHLLGVEQDRKSTRLNSSHVKNSYAVFCLKKKKHSQL